MFNKDEHIMQIKSSKGSSDYLPVAWRLVWFREKYPQGSIETEMLLLDLDKEVQEEAYVWNAEKRKSEKVTKLAKGIAIFRAIVKDGQGGVATGTKQENAASFPDYIEKAETGSIGRALAALGYGTQFAPDFDEEHRIVDSPVERAVQSAEIDKLRASWAAAYNIAENQIQERWIRYLPYVLDTPMSESELKRQHITKITNDIEQQKNRNARQSA
ncbi:MAG: hypothetical protein PVS3B3_24810 [Ktedonobacteraceae bacterium]